MDLLLFGFVELFEKIADKLFILHFIFLTIYLDAGLNRAFDDYSFWQFQTKFDFGHQILRHLQLFTIFQASY